MTAEINIQLKPEGYFGVAQASDMTSCRASLLLCVALPLVTLEAKLCQVSNTFLETTARVGVGGSDMFVRGKDQ